MAALLACGALLWPGSAAAWECTRYDPISVAPGTHQRVAPRNTQVFVYLAPGWARHATFPSEEAKSAVDDSLQGIELCKATPEDAWTVEDGCEELQVQWELSPAARASRREILALPKAPLKAGAWYVVVAKTKTGPARLADFAVADRSDEKPPRIANVVEHDFDDRVAGMGGPGRKRAQLRVASVFDDTTEDAALRFEVFDETGKAQGKLSTALLATRPGSGQATFLDLTEHDDCRPGNFRFPKDPSKRAYSVRAVDLAGNASAKVTVEIRGQGQPDELTQPKPEPLPPLYYVPKLGVFSKPTVYRATGALLSFVLLLGLWLAWRRGQ